MNNQYINIIVDYILSHAGVDWENYDCQFPKYIVCPFCHSKRNASDALFDKIDKVKPIDVIHHKDDCAYLAAKRISGSP